MKHALLAALLLWIAALPSFAITSGRLPVATDRRFDAVAGFTRTEWQNINNVFGNATLIAPDRVVLSRHLINDQFWLSTSTDGAPADFTVRFRRRPDGGLGDVATPASFYHVRIKSWIFPADRKVLDDIIIGVLETPVTHIAPMAMDFKAKVSPNSTVMLASWGPESSESLAPKGRLLLGNVKVRSAGGWVALAPKTKSAPSEVVLHDSGAPILQVSGKTVRMVGLVTNTTGGPGLKPFNGTRLFPTPPRR